MCNVFVFCFFNEIFHVPTCVWRPPAAAVSSPSGSFQILLNPRQQRTQHVTRGLWWRHLRPASDLLNLNGPLAGFRVTLWIMGKGLTLASNFPLRTTVLWSRVKKKKVLKIYVVSYSFSHTALCWDTTFNILLLLFFLLPISRKSTNNKYLLCTLLGFHFPLLGWIYLSVSNGNYMMVILFKLTHWRNYYWPMHSSFYPFWFIVFVIAPMLCFCLIYVKLLVQRK